MRSGMSIEQRIAVLREKLNTLVDNRDLQLEVVIKVSQDLDLLISEYYRGLKAKK